MSLNITTLNNAELDFDHIARVATSDEPTSTNREGRTDLTLAGLIEDLNAAAAITETGANRAAVAADRAVVEEIAQSAQSSSRTVPTWSFLSGLTPTVIGEGAEVLDADTGTHTDPSTSATVANAGRYRAYATTLGAWTWISETGLSSKLPAKTFDARFQSFPNAGILAALTDRWGYPTWIGARDDDGGPTALAVQMLAAALGLSGTEQRMVGWRALFGAALAGSASRVQCIGDSQTCGVGLTKQKAWPSKLADAVEALGVQLAGDGFNSPFPSAVPDSRWTFTGSWQFEPGDTGRNLCAKALTTGSTATYAPARPCTDITIFWYGGSGNGASVSVDGGSPVVIESYIGPTAIKSHTFSGLAKAAHTIQIVSTGIFEMVGVSTHGAGLVIDNLGRSGISTSGWAATGDQDLSAIYEAVVGLAPTGRHGTFVALGTNDCIRALPPSDNGVSLEDFVTNTQSIIDLTSGNGPVALVTPAPMANSPRDEPIRAYADALLDAARENDLLCFDLLARWRDFSTASDLGFIGGDNLHLGATGAADLARCALAATWA